MDGSRVREIRKALGLTLDEFGSKLGVTKQTISRIENGVNGLTDQMVRSICREYKVNYDWLVYGDGEMFDDLSGTILDELCIEYGCDAMDRKIIESYLKLDARTKQALKDYISKLLGE